MATGKGRPSPGDLVIIEHPYVYDKNMIARVVKVGPVMWEIEQRWQGEWLEPVKRKILSFFIVDRTADPDRIRELLMQADQRHIHAKKQIKTQYIDRVKAIADGSIK